MLIPPGLRYMTGSALAFSVMGAAVKLLGERLPSQEIVLFRAGISLVLSWALLVRAGRSPWGESRGLLLLRGVFGFLGLSCVFFAVTHLPLAEATILQYLHPTFTALLAALFLGERSGPGLLASMALGLAGVTLIARPGSWPVGGAVHDPLALAVAVGGAFFSACAYVAVRRLASREDPLVIVFYFPLVAVPATLPTVWGQALWPQGIEWPLLLAVGVGAQLGQVWLTRGLQLEPAPRATALSYLQVVFSTLWGLWLFGERPGPATLAGAGLIFLATLAALRGRVRVRGPGAEAG